MIDTEKMKALAAKLRKYTGSGFVVDDATEAADAIDTLLAALEAATNKADYFESACALADSTIDSRNRNIDEIVTFNKELSAALEAATADKRDAERYRLLNSIPFGPGVPASYRGIYFSFAVSDGKPGFIRSCRGEEMNAAIDAALSQRQEES